jgi:D-3-phosphoglycerate dehydrogenase
MIATEALERLPRGAIVANFARGGIIDEPALAAALEADHLAGALLDVYATEPLPADHPFRLASNVLLTPHLGASTVEGQRNVAVDVCIAVRDALLSGQLSGAVNLAAVDRARWSDLRGALYLARQEAAIARAMLAERGARVPEQLTVHFGPQFIGADSLLGSAAAEGLLAAIVNNDRVNIVNARERATERGIAIATVPLATTDDAQAVRVTVSGSGTQLTIGGTATPGAAPRITRIGEFKVDIAPRRTLIVLTNVDVPGVIGQVGTVLGSAGINIAEYHQARMTQGGEALAAISVDGTVSEQVRRRLLDVASVRSATVVEGDRQDADIFE